MKQFVFEAKSHGQYSFSVMAEDEISARASVQKEIDRARADEHVTLEKHDVSEWPKRYWMTIYEVNEVAYYAND